MTLDRSFVDRNQAATARLENLVFTLSDADLQRPVGEHWTVAVALAHIAFWDARVLNILDLSEQAKQVSVPKIDVAVNDIALPFWSALPPREAAQLALKMAEQLDQWLETFPADLLEQIAAVNNRYVERSAHRSQHLDEIEQALRA